MDKPPSIVAHDGELRALYQRLRDLHRESAVLVRELGVQHDQSLWTKIRTIDEEIAEVWRKVREIEQLWPLHD